MRTQKEIIEYMRNDDHLFKWGSEVLVPYLSYDSYLEIVSAANRDDGEVYTREKWEGGDEPFPISEDTIETDMIEYIKFALDKAFNHRGLSADRSIAKLDAWVWLAGNDELLKQFRNAQYQNYGVPKLMVLVKEYDVEVEDYMRKPLERMAKGLPCSPFCDEGCARVYSTEGEVQ